MTKKTMLSAMSPSHGLQLGNYLGALVNWVRLQDSYDCIFFGVDLHTITVKQDPAVLRQNSRKVLAEYIAAGIDPSKSLLFMQSHVPEHAELAWILNCFTYMGELGRMTQYKDKSQKEGTSIGVGLFTYPVLMAADILLYQSDLVPVGEDQKQHVELTRDLALRMNNRFGDLFKVPEPWIPPVGARIMSLQDPAAKMSKSDSNPHATVFLQDTDDVILKKFKRAVTDSGTEIKSDWNDKPGVSNLLEIQSTLLKKPIAEIEASYLGKMYGHLKVETAEIVIAHVAPLRAKSQELMAEPGYLEGVMKQGAEKARVRAQPTLRKVCDAMGFLTRNAVTRNI